MSYNGMYETIANEFVNEYYRAVDQKNFQLLAQMYHKDSMLTFEDARQQGTDSIIEKLRSLPFTTIKHIITKTDAQPTIDGGILILVTGQLKIDDEKPHAFSHTFILLEIQGECPSFFIKHEIFRLSLHNIPVL